MKRGAMSLRWWFHVGPNEAPRHRKSPWLRFDLAGMTTTLSDGRRIVAGPGRLYIKACP